MSKDLTLKNKNEVATADDIQVLKDSMFKDFTDSEVKFSMAVANQLSLSPLLRQVHFVKRFDKKLNRNVVTPQTGIDGLRLIADRTGKYAGSDDVVFEYEGNIKKQPTLAKATVYKMVEGQRIPFTVSARWEEFYPGDVMGFMWKSKPHIMLGKCAEGQALRKAFPAELSSVYADEELEQADADDKKASRIQQALEKESDAFSQAVANEMAKGILKPQKAMKFNENDAIPIAADILNKQEVETVNLDADPVEPFESFDESKAFEKAESYFKIEVGKELKGKMLMECDKPYLEKWARSTKEWFIKEKIKINPKWQETFENIGQYLGKDI